MAALEVLERACKPPTLRTRQPSGGLVLCCLALCPVCLFLPRSSMTKNPGAKGTKLLRQRRETATADWSPRGWPPVSEPAGDL